MIAALGLFALFVYLNLDKTHVFLDVAGELGEVKSETVRSDDTSVVQALKFHNRAGAFVADGLYRRPNYLSDRYRVMVLYTGVKTKAAIMDLIPDQPDVVLLAVQYPYERPRAWKEYLRWPWTVRQAGYRVVAGGMLAVTFLIEREKLDPRRFTVVGASLGSFFGGIHGSIDTRIRRVLIVHGGGNFPDIARYYHRERKRPWPAALGAFLFDSVLGAFDPVRYVDRISPRELTILAAKNDRYFPPESAQSLYDRAKPPKGLIWMESPHVRSKKSETVDAILHSLKNYFFSPGLNMPSPDR
ncbi:hypothetical protein HY522_01820 [bacterium]|nr:hypothetical protein [bacterium]